MSQQQDDRSNSSQNNAPPDKEKDAKELANKLVNKKLESTACNMNPEILPKAQKMSETEKARNARDIRDIGDTKETRKNRVAEETKEVKEMNVVKDTEKARKFREMDKMNQSEETRETGSSKKSDQTVKIDETKIKTTNLVDMLSNLTEKNVEKKLTTTNDTVESEEVLADNKSQAKVTKVPVLEKCTVQKPSNAAVPRRRPPLWTPMLNERPLVLATHLVPSLPISVFEILVEMIEVALQKPVVLLYEPRRSRKVAKDLVDIAILPAAEEWEDGNLLGASFVFKHRLNKENTPCVYADILVASDRAPHIEDVSDLRGHRCALPDRTGKIGAAALLFSHLHSRGEGPAFFGNILDADSHIAALQMIAGKQAEIGILEAPVISCHKNILPGVESLHILTSLGPLPPYRIMFNKRLSDVLMEKVTSYLLNSSQVEEWLERLEPFGITGFATNSADLYTIGDMKPIVTRVPYY